MASIFSKIVKGDIPCYKIAETKDFLAFLDVYPLANGHTLVIPKIEVDYIFDLEDATYLGLMEFAKTVAKGIEKAVPCKKIGIAVIGLEVAHAHIHLVPINNVSDINFSRQKLTPSAQDLESTAKSIQAFLN